MKRILSIILIAFIAYLCLSTVLIFVVHTTPLTRIKVFLNRPQNVLYTKDVVLPLAVKTRISMYPDNCWAYDATEGDLVYLMPVRARNVELESILDEYGYPKTDENWNLISDMGTPEDILVYFSNVWGTKPRSEKNDMLHAWKDYWKNYFYDYTCDTYDMMSWFLPETGYNLDLHDPEILNTGPELEDGSGYVEPLEGNTTTEFTFLVKYFDVDGDAPTVKHLYVYDSGWQYFDMDHVVGNPIDGEWFMCKLTSFSLGAHDFYFYFSDGMFDDYEPETGYLSFTVVRAAKIDVYTQKGGEGPNQPDGFFAPDETVHLNALVTYNEQPVAHCFVAFEVIDPLGTCVFYGTSETDEAGIAVVSFRIPLPVENPEAVFGTWNATAQASLAEQKVYDTVTFEVGWYVEITSIETGVWQDEAYWIPKTEFEKLEPLDVKMTYNKICDDPLNVIFYIHAYDNCDVPIFRWNSSYTLSGPINESLFIHMGTIPTSTYIGEAKVYADAYNKPPEDGGVPYCPEVSSNFIIIKGPLLHIYLSSRTTDDQVNVGSITFDGETYSLPTTVSKDSGIYQATGNPPDGYSFDSWEYSGGISVSDPTSQTTQVTVSEDCSLTAVFLKVEVHISYPKIENFYSDKEPFDILQALIGQTFGDYTHVTIDVTVTPINLIDHVNIKISGITYVMDEVEPGHYRREQTASASQAFCAKILLIWIQARVGLPLPFTFTVVPLKLEGITVVDIYSNQHSRTFNIDLPTAESPLLDKWSGTTTVALCPVDILIRDTLNRKVGALYEDGKFVAEVNEISGAFYTGRMDDGPEFIYLPFAAEEYELEIFGIETTAYNLTVFTLVDGNSSYQTFEEEIVQGGIVDYEISISETADVSTTKTTAILIDDSEDEWGYSGDVDNPQYAVDENWTTYASGDGYVFENFSKPQGVVSANWTFKMGAIEDPNYEGWYWNYSKNDWSLLYSAPFTIDSVVTFSGTFQVRIPSDGLMGNKVRIKTHLKSKITGFGTMDQTWYYEGKVTWIFWAPPDVAITNLVLSKTLVGQGHDVFIHVTLENKGYFTEIFNVTAYYNETAITLPNGKNYITVTLTSGNSITINFTWDTTGVPYGNYTISTYAHPVPSETDTDNNTYIDGTVTVTSPTGVGGIWIPVDKFGLLAPYIGLTLTIVSAIATAMIFIKLKKRKL